MLLWCAILCAEFNSFLWNATQGEKPLSGQPCPLRLETLTMDLFKAPTPIFASGGILVVQSSILALMSPTLAELSDDAVCDS